MARRNDASDALLLQVPWWIFLALAPIVYLVMAYGLSTWIGDTGLGPGLKQAVSVMAVVPALGCVLMAVRLAVRQLGARHLLDRQTGIASIRAMTWTELERLVAEAYRRQGYVVLETGRRGPDGGVDLVVERDGRHLVQCKHWKAYRVGVKEVRELFGLVAAEPADGGVLVTSGDFTQEARAFAAGKPLDLIDGARLVELVKSVQPASRRRSAEPEAAVTVPVASPSSTRRSVTPEGCQQPPVTGTEHTCPRCGRAMVVRTARRGANAGNQFLGCSGYPQCRATEPLPT